MPIMKRIIPVLLSGWMFACINVPEIEPVRTPDSGSGPAEVPDAGPPPLGDLAVTITSPVDVFYSSTQVPITVEVRGGTVESVQLLKDGKPLATLSTPPFQYTWDTTQETEGRYSLTARALRGSKRFDSAAVAVVVDRTNLQVASRSPAHGATNVDYSEPFRVVFTKPVKASTVNDTTVSFAVSGISTEKTLTLSSDGMTLTISPKERPNLPATFAFGVSRGVTDLAGNALATPITQSSSPWSFEVPDWYAFGGALEAIPGTDTQIKDSTMILGADGNPIIAWSEQITPNGKFSLFVYRWDGKSFVRLGYPINGTQNGSAFKASLALAGDGQPVVAWEESISTGSVTEESIYVARWTGTSWSLVGSGYLSAENDSKTPTPAHNPSLAVKGNDIYVAWDEADVTGVSAIRVWRSTNGQPFAGVGDKMGMVNALAQSSNGTRPSIVVDSKGQPIVGFQEKTPESNSSTRVYVMRLQSGTWIYAVPVPAMSEVNRPSDYGGISAFNETAWASDVSLAIDSQDQLYAAWTEETASEWIRDVHVFKSVDSKTWLQVGQTLSEEDGYSSPSDQANIAVGKGGNIIVTWQEFFANTDKYPQLIYSRRWSNNKWTPLTPNAGLNYGQRKAICSALVVDSVNRPFIVWIDSKNSDSYALGDYIHVRRRNE